MVAILNKSCLPLCQVCVCVWMNPPVCVRMCPWSSQGLEKALPHSLHTQGSVCVRMCIFNAPRLLYSLSQYLQLKYLGQGQSHCSCLCLVRPEKVKYALWQSRHSKWSWKLPEEDSPSRDAVTSDMASGTERELVSVSECRRGSWLTGWVCVSSSVTGRCSWGVCGSVGAWREFRRYGSDKECSGWGMVCSG